MTTLTGLSADELKKLITDTENQNVLLQKKEDVCENSFKKLLEEKIKAVEKLHKVDIELKDAKIEELEEQLNETYTWEDVEEKASDLCTSTICDAIDEECYPAPDAMCLENYVKGLKAQIKKLQKENSCNCLAECLSFETRTPYGGTFKHPLEVIKDMDKEFIDLLAGRNRINKERNKLKEELEVAKLCMSSYVSKQDIANYVGACWTEQYDWKDSFRCRDEALEELKKENVKLKKEIESMEYIRWEHDANCDEIKKLRDEIKKLKGDMAAEHQAVKGAEICKEIVNAMVEDAMN